MTTLDRRVNAFRPDLADAGLRGQVEAGRFVEGRRAMIVCGSAPLRRDPSPGGALDTEALMGEAITVFEEEEGWAWVQLARDSYVGYLPDYAYRFVTHPPTHRLAVPRSFVYPGASMKLPHVDVLSQGARLTVVAEEGDFALLATGGAVWRRHLVPVDTTMPDYVAVAERLEYAPYLWGGRTTLGLDCSGLVQLALDAAGIAAPRDSDMMERELGQPLAIGDDLAGLRRGDLVFWKGHVGLMADAGTLLHANGHFMQVTREPLRVAVERIAARAVNAGTGIGWPTGFRRI
jgi:cell wall-associated NlpC family hydrolase